MRRLRRRYGSPRGVAGAGGAGGGAAGTAGGALDGCGTRAGILGALIVTKRVLVQHVHRSRLEITKNESVRAVLAIVHRSTYYVVLKI